MERLLVFSILVALVAATRSGLGGRHSSEESYFEEYSDAYVDETRTRVNAANEAGITTKASSETRVDNIANEAVITNKASSETRVDNAANEAVITNKASSETRVDNAENEAGITYKASSDVHRNEELVKGFILGNLYHQLAMANEKDASQTTGESSNSQAGTTKKKVTETVQTVHTVRSMPGSTRTVMTVQQPHDLSQVQEAVSFPQSTISISPSIPHSNFQVEGFNSFPNPSYSNSGYQPNYQSSGFTGGFRVPEPYGP